MDTLARVVRRGALLPAVVLALSCLTIPAHADRRYFLFTYSPFLDEAGEAEIETWFTARAGKQDAGIPVGWEPRLEYEYALHDRFTAAAYLNFAKQPGEHLQFESPSLELIYRFQDAGKLLGDPAIYLETTESGDELELESKLLLAHRRNRFMSALNLVGEFEFRHDDRELLPSGHVLRNGFAGEITGGVAYEASHALSVGLETRYRSEHPNFGRQSAALLAVGPSLNVRAGKGQLALGVMPQVWGTPGSSGGRNLVDFESMQVRAIVGLEL